MAWSTRELAELAGTTLKTVRYYHRIGLLDEPERGANGYKRYRLSHLIRLLRIRRLVDLGVPLSDIEAMDESDGNAERTLRALDAELKVSIERQERMRKELALILERRSLVDLPPGFDGDVADLSEVERSMLMVFSRVLDAETMDAVRELHAAPRHPAQAELDKLPADADEATRQRVAEALAPVARDQIEAQPSLTDARTRVALSEPTVLSGLVELYNPAQLDVLRRLNTLIEKKEKGP
ncbi:MerR family transcriptional regulator [Amycolatopsis azurea]|uniref:MerR family transcriptional regulator n=1 Tax=Amycolatopsis azurea DSM 43854 TaxID=1238180 RepID=M2PJ72_9PSEU|nr:MerR family transcriptional regulator [Amycolatopsis azurea]EMD24478.1 Transcriptional regulator, MerR family [Amycolatopsis azurea DSM 43854]OOC01136.1 MerR family transcriptional regulator [Amycolatopsis azurea DSM 43854]